MPHFFFSNKCCVSLLHLEFQTPVSLSLLRLYQTMYKNNNLIKQTQDEEVVKNYKNECYKKLD